MVDRRQAAAASSTYRRLLRRPAPREQAVGALELDIRERDADLAVGEARDLRPVGADDAGRGALIGAGAGRRGDVDGALERAAHQRLLVVGVRRIAPARRQRAVIGHDPVRHEHDLGARARERARGLGVAERLVADGDAERDTGGAEQTAAAAGDVVGLLGGVDLGLGLHAERRPVGADHDRDDLAPGGGDALGPHDRDDAAARRRRREPCDRAVERPVRQLRHVTRLAAVAGNRGLGQADDAGAGRRRPLDGGDRRRDRLVERRRERRRGHRDADAGISGQLVDRALRGRLVVAPAHDLRAVADAPVADVVVDDLDDELRPQRDPFELAVGGPAARIAAAALAGLVRCELGDQLALRGGRERRGVPDGRSPPSGS